MRTTASPLNFLTSKLYQFIYDFSIFHYNSTGINVSVQIAELGVVFCKTAGKGIFKSSYPSIKAAKASATLGVTSFKLSASVIKSGKIGHVIV